MSDGAPTVSGTSPDGPIDRERVKRDFIAARGYWKDWTEQLLEHAPSFLDLYARYGGHPARTGPLSPQMCELIYIALDSSATHLFVSGLKTHIRLALQLGVTPGQIVEVFRIATGQGLDGYVEGSSIVIEEMMAAGMAVAEPAAPVLDQARAVYFDQLGNDPAGCEAMSRLDPEHFALAAALLAPPPESGGLDECQRLLIRIALAGCFLSFKPRRLRALVQRALAEGCTPAEIVQVLQMTAHLAVHACSVGIPVLSEVLRERAAPRGEENDAQD